MRVNVETGKNIAEFHENCKAAVTKCVGDRYFHGTGHKHVSYEITYQVPKSLYMGKRQGNVTATKHVVREVFFKDGCAYYVPMGRRSTGWRLTTHGIVCVTVVYAEEDYSDRWAKIARSMRKHNINLSMAADIEAYLRGETEHIAGTGNYYTKLDKPQCSSFSDVTGGKSIADMWAARSPADEFSGEHFYACKYGAKRDRNVSLSKADDGSYRFFAASEFAGCGNGYYYLMYSPKMAVFLEKD